MVSHADGTLIIYDREREDSLFVPRDPGANPILSAAAIPNAPNGTVSNTLDPSLNPNAPSHPGKSGSSLGSDAGEAEEWRPLEEILVTPGPSGGGVPAGKERVLKNPVSHWRVSRKSINCEFTFVSTHGWTLVADLLLSLRIRTEL